MQLQTFEGYLENERFFPIGKPIKKSGKQRVLITFLNDPILNDPVVEAIEAEPKDELLQRLKEAIAESADEYMPDIVRCKKMRPPVDWD